MSRNTRRHNNQVPIRALSPWLIIAILALMGGMSWVYLANQKFARGKEIKKLETQLAELEKQNKALLPRIVTLSSRAALQKRVDEGFIRMVPITQDRIVQISPAQSTRTVALAGDEIRPVSNGGVGR